jgi:uncharacterized delta-60 repeat protein
MMAFSPAIGGQPIAVAGNSYELSLLPTPQAHDALTRWEINWGDGTPVEQVDPNATVAPHTYATPGTYAVTGRALLSGGGGFSRWAPFGLDPSFGTGGRGTIAELSTTGAEMGRAMAVQPDGKILVAGQAHGGDFGVARFNADGTPDWGFGGTGTAMVSTDIDNNSTDIAWAIALQADGKIVVGGISNNSSWTLVRYNTDGTLDDGGFGDSTFQDRFGTNGRVVTPFAPVSGNTQANVYGLAIQPDGKIIAVGSSPGVYGARFTATRYWPGGVLDQSFGTGGKAYVDFTNYRSWGRDVAIQPDGKIVLAGDACYAGTPAQFDFAVARILPTGQVDTSFGSSGKVVTDFGSSSSSSSYSATDRAYSIVLQPDGKIVLAGESQGNFGLARYNANGSLDSGTTGDATPGDSFGSGGRTVVDFNGGSDAAYDLALQRDGKLVAAGYAATTSAPGAPRDLAVLRLSATGMPDPTWGSTLPGGTGEFFVDVGGTPEAAYGVSLLPDGDIVVGGEGRADDGVGGTTPAFAVARFQPYNKVDVHQNVYFQDFSGTAGPEWAYSPDALALMDPPSTNLGMLGLFRENESEVQDQDIWTTLSLASLPTHTQLTLSFDLPLSESWDGLTESSDRWAYDHWMVSADGVNLLDTTFSVNFDPPQRQSYSKARHDGVFQPFTDSESGGLYRMSLTFAHTRSAVQIRFASNTSTSSGAWGTDEAWALDNVRVSIPSGPLLSEPVDPDLRIDSDNDGVNVTTPNPNDPLPDYAEWHDDGRQEWDWTEEGTRIALNTDDDDVDLIPDFADGYNRDPANSNDNLVATENDFTKMVLDLSRIVNRGSANVRFLYNGSNPAAVTYAGGTYTPGPGRLRIWRKQGNVARVIGDYIEPGKVYSGSALGLSNTVGAVELWIEAIGASGSSKYFSDEPIRVELDPTGAQVFFNASDEVLVTVRDPNLSLTPPEPVVAVFASAQSSSHIALSWSPQGVADGYRIYRSKVYSFTPSGSDLVATITDPAQTTYDDIGLDPSTQYFYRVEAFNAHGESDPSILDDQASARTAPIPPGNLTAQRVGSQTNLTWENRSGSRNVRLLRSTDPNFGAFDELDPGPFASSYVDDSVLASGTYYYKVVVIDELGHRSDASNTVSVVA